MKDVVLTERGPRPIGPYSQAIKSGGFVFTAGQVALDPATVRAAAPKARLVGLGDGSGCDAALEVPFTADNLVRAVAGVLYHQGPRP